MFGADFFQQFGLSFPFFGQTDMQGGLFAALQAPEPNAQPHQGMEPTHSPSPPGAQAAAVPQPKPAAGASPLASPMAPQASGAAPQQSPSPLERRGSFGLEQRMM